MITIKGLDTEPGTCAAAIGGDYFAVDGILQYAGAAAGAPMIDAKGPHTATATLTGGTRP